MLLYGDSRPHVQIWMRKLKEKGFLEKTTRAVVRTSGKRPPGETGYQLVASKIVDEMNRTLIENTDHASAFRDGEKRSLTEFLDSEDARRLLGAALTPSNIVKARSYDFCTMLSLILGYSNYVIAKRKPIDVRDLEKLVSKVADHPNIDHLISQIAHRVSNSFRKPISKLDEDQLKKELTLRSADFAIRFLSFISRCSPKFLEKLRWCTPVPLPVVFGLAETLGKISFPSDDRSSVPPRQRGGAPP